MPAIVPVFACGLAQNYAFGHGFAVLPCLLRGTGFVSRTGRNAGQRRSRTARLHQPGWSAVYQPSHLVCCWDNDWRPQWRVELIPSYKAHRVAQAGDAVGGGDGQLGRHRGRAGARRPRRPGAADILAVLDALGIAVVGHDGYEADDVIGTLAATAPMPVDVVTGDRDLFQVVDDDRAGAGALHRPRGRQARDGGRRLGRGRSTASRRRAYVDYATLRGDASDGLPGVAGIGEKTAASLINSHGDLEGILAEASRPEQQDQRLGPAKLAAAIDYLAVAPTVVGGGPRPRPGRRLGRPGAAARSRRVPNGSPSSPSCSALGASADRIVAALAGDA